MPCPGPVRFFHLVSVLDILKSRIVAIAVRFRSINCLQFEAAANSWNSLLVYVFSLNQKINK